MLAQLSTGQFFMETISADTPLAGPHPLQEFLKDPELKTGGEAAPPIQLFRHRGGMAKANPSV